MWRRLDIDALDAGAVGMVGQVTKGRIYIEGTAVRHTADRRGIAIGRSRLPEKGKRELHEATSLAGLHETSGSGSGSTKYLCGASLATPIGIGIASRNNLRHILLYSLIILLNTSG